eukprot:CAMPEP_0170493296 /NCGR_PEP_ID=MMETSP0208-20121228/13664_1 /TAXON_ID=197538 /ORGANISM="Strombidium inclinatum, Strain S3" /LENGTH=204 /DNA_ID=CAMNT_0010769203 /DNA_START=125 /DNA_END=739 /DNA_ORIENTATION=+
MDEAGNVVGGHMQQDEENSDSDFDSDGDDSIMQSLREQRMKEMKKKQQEHIENINKGHGRYMEISEDEFLPTVTKTNFCIVHFYHKDFERCKIINMHLEQIARQHMEAKFVKIDAEKCPFFVTKLQVQVLPTIVCFINGVAADRVIGFEELGGKDEFPTILLARRLVNSGCLKALNRKEKGEIKIKKGRRDISDSDENNDDSDD